MMLAAIVGQCDDVDAVDAARDVLDQCRAALGGRLPSGGLLFAGVDYAHEVLLAAILDEYPDLPLIGCTTAGEISSDSGLMDDSVLLVLFVSDEVHFAAGVGRQLSEDLTGAARSAVRQARERLDGPPRLCITLPEGLTTNVSAVLDELANALGDRGFPIFGGTAADRGSFSQTRQFCGREVLDDAVPVLLLSGALSWGEGVVSGWEPLGAMHRVTSSEGNVVRAIDDQPALDIYRHYLGERVAEFFGEFPLAVFPDGSSERFFLRAVFDADLDTGALVLGGTLPEGSQVRVANAKLDRVLMGTEEAMRRALESYTGEAPSVALAFCCAGRNYVLGKRAPEEASRLASIMSAAGSAAPKTLAGFYAFGEIAPLVKGGAPVYHNETCAILVLGTG